MDWKALAKAEDKLAKAVNAMEEAGDGSKRDRAEQKVLDAARAWAEQFGSRSDDEIKALRAAEKDLDKAYQKQLDAAGQALDKARAKVGAKGEAVAQARLND